MIINIFKQYAIKARAMLIRTFVESIIDKDDILLAIKRMELKQSESCNAVSHSIFMEWMSENNVQLEKIHAYVVDELNAHNYRNGGFAGCEVRLAGTEVPGEIEINLDFILKPLIFTTEIKTAARFEENRLLTIIVGAEGVKVVRQKHDEAKTDKEHDEILNITEALTDEFINEMHKRHQKLENYMLTCMVEAYDPCLIIKAIPVGI